MNRYNELGLQMIPTIQNLYIPLSVQLSVCEGGVFVPSLAEWIKHLMVNNLYMLKSASTLYQDPIFAEGTVPPSGYKLPSFTASILALENFIALIDLWIIAADMLQTWTDVKDAAINSVVPTTYAMVLGAHFNVEADYLEFVSTSTYASDAYNLLINMFPAVP